jgi:hypothetical protein
MLNIAKEKIGELTGTALKCASHEQCELESKLWPVNLPWKSELELSGTTVIENLMSVKDGSIGWEVECKALGVSEDDICTFTLGEPIIENMTVEKGVLGILYEENKIECSLSKDKSGDINASGLTKLLSGAELEVSGE